MDKLHKILICIIIVLIIILAGVTYSYFKVRSAAKQNLNDFLNATERIHELERRLENN